MSNSPIPSEFPLSKVRVPWGREQTMLAIATLLPILFPIGVGLAGAPFLVFSLLLGAALVASLLPREFLPTEVVDAYSSISRVHFKYVMAEGLPEEFSAITWASEDLLKAVYLKQAANEDYSFEVSELKRFSAELTAYDLVRSKVAPVEVTPTDSTTLSLGKALKELDARAGGSAGPLSLF